MSKLFPQMLGRGERQYRGAVGSQSREACDMTQTGAIRGGFSEEVTFYYVFKGESQSEQKQ